MILLLVCYMHFNNYFVEHRRGDMWGGGGGGGGGGVITLVLNKEAGVTCYLHGLQGGLT